MDASIIIPAYNAEKTIEACLESVLNQDYDGDYEVIVVDDGSRDRTKALAKKYPVRVIEQPNSGPAIARNRGAKKARGTVIVFTDSDCVAEKNWLREMLKPFAGQEIGGVQGSYKCSQRELMARFIQLEIEERYKKMRRQKYTDFVASYSAAYKKEAFFNSGGFDENFPIASGEDTELAFRIAAKGNRFVYNPEAVVYHTHPTSLGKYLRVKFFRGYWRIPVYKRHLNKIADDSYTSRILKGQIALNYAFVLTLIAWPLVPQLSYILAAEVAVFALSTLPFMFFAVKRDFAAGIVSPVLSALNAAAISSGFAYGLVKGVFRR